MEHEEELNEIKSTGDVLKEIKVRKSPRGIHSEHHELIDRMRKYFGETAVKGVGSFSYYLGMLKKVPIPTIYMWINNIRQSPKINTPTARAKVFWWKYKQWRGGKP